MYQPKRVCFLKKKLEYYVTINVHTRKTYVNLANMCLYLNNYNEVKQSGESKEQCYLFSILNVSTNKKNSFDPFIIVFLQNQFRMKFTMKIANILFLFPSP